MYKRPLLILALILASSFPGAEIVETEGSLMLTLGTIGMLKIAKSVLFGMGARYRLQFWTASLKTLINLSQEIARLASYGPQLSIRSFVKHAKKTQQVIEAHWKVGLGQSDLGLLYNALKHKFNEMVFALTGENITQPEAPPRPKPWEVEPRPADKEEPPAPAQPRPYLGRPFEESQGAGVLSPEQKEAMYAKIVQLVRQGNYLQFKRCDPYRPLLENDPVNMYLGYGHNGEQIDIACPPRPAASPMQVRKNLVDSYRTLMAA